MKFNELQNILKDKLGIEHLADVARELGVTPQAVSNWKARDKVPYKYIIMIRKKYKRLDKSVDKIDDKDPSFSNQNLVKDNYDTTYEDENISFADVILILASNIKIILVTASTLCLLSIIYAIFYTSPFYNSTSKIMSSVGAKSNSQALGIAAQFGINLPTNNSEAEWAYGPIINSRTLAQEVIKRKFDTVRYGSQKTLLQILSFQDKQPTMGLDTLEIIAIDKFINMIDLIEDPRTRIYTITITTFEPQLAVDINNALIEELVAYQRNYNKTITSKTRRFIQERIIDTEKDLQNAEETLKNFRDRNRRIENSPALLLDQQRLLREVSVLTGVFTTLKQQLETTKIEEVKDSDYVIILDRPVLPLHKSGPNRRKMVVTAGMLGIGIGVVLSFVINYFQKNDDEEKKKIQQIKIIALKNVYDFFPFLNIFAKK